jgi:DNA polymerase-3 subunit gamma/tau
MSYIVYARKWRPQTFDDIIGQEHITRTLKNAVKNDRVAHAYLFAGPRGVGKTSAARILAKALNCAQGPTPEPCNTCTACTEIAESRSLDVLEIDGASNRGIDEVRTLRENIKFAPAHGTYKIYIIDEVHMLTQEAFNALLKTLEEPPAHVAFVFATTQPNKVLSTIISRCQRFDFRGIATKDIVAKLNRIADSEKLKITEEALFAIARAANGGMRDAESILDQLASFTNKKIDAADVTQVLGTLHEATLAEIVDAIMAKDAPRALTIIDGLLKEGKDLSFVCTALLEYFRNMLMVKVGTNLNELIDVSAESIEKLLQQGKQLTVEDVLYALHILTRTQETIRRTTMSRIPLEMAVVKLTIRDSIHPLQEVLDRIAALDAGIQEEEEKPSQPMNTETPQPVPKRAAPRAEQTQPPAPPEKKEPGGAVALATIEDIWVSLIRSIRVKKMSVATYLSEGRPVSYEGDVLMLGFPEGRSFHREALEEPQSRKLIQDTLSEMLGITPVLTFVTVSDEPKKTYSTQDEALQEIATPPAAPKPDPLIDSALDIFDGKVVRKRKQEP